MAQGLFRKEDGLLRPADDHARETLSHYRSGSHVRAELRRVRNPRQLALWWALAGVLSDHAEWCASREDASDWLKIAVGHFEIVRSPDGKEWARPKSIAFGNCAQDEFDQILNNAIRVICEKVIPNTSSDALRTRLEEIVGGPRKVA